MESPRPVCAALPSPEAVKCAPLQTQHRVCDVALFPTDLAVRAVALSSLQLAHNQLEGPIDYLWNNPFLSELDVEGNKLDGRSWGVGGLELGATGDRDGVHANVLVHVHRQCTSAQTFVGLTHHLCKQYSTHSCGPIPQAVPTAGVGVRLNNSSALLSCCRPAVSRSPHHTSLCPCRQSPLQAGQAQPPQTHQPGLQQVNGVYRIGVKCWW